MLGVDLSLPPPSSPAWGWQEKSEPYYHPGKNSNQEPPFRCGDEAVSLFSRAGFNGFAIKELIEQELQERQCWSG